MVCLKLKDKTAEVPGNRIAVSFGCLNLLKRLCEILSSSPFLRGIVGEILRIELFYL